MIQIFYNTCANASIRLANMATVLQNHQPFMNVGVKMLPRSWECMWYLIAATKTFLAYRAYDEQYVHPFLTCLLFCILSLTYNMYAHISDLTVVVMIPYCTLLTTAMCYGRVNIVPFILMWGANFYPPLEFIWDVHMVASTAVEFLSEAIRSGSVRFVWISLSVYSLVFLICAGEVVTEEDEYSHLLWFSFTCSFLLMFVVNGVFYKKMNEVTMCAAGFNLAVLMIYIL